MKRKGAKAQRGGGKEGDKKQDQEGKEGKAARRKEKTRARPQGANPDPRGTGRVPAAMSLHFTSNATFDIGIDTDSPVALDYYDQAPFKFNGTIGKTSIQYLKK